MGARERVQQGAHGECLEPRGGRPGGRDIRRARGRVIRARLERALTNATLAHLFLCAGIVCSQRLEEAVSSLQGQIAAASHSGSAPALDEKRVQELVAQQYAPLAQQVRVGHRRAHARFSSSGGWDRVWDGVHRSLSTHFRRPLPPSLTGRSSLFVCVSTVHFALYLSAWSLAHSCAQLVDQRALIDQIAVDRDKKQLEIGTFASVEV